jgi:hypothetical protein
MLENYPNLGCLDRKAHATKAGATKDVGFASETGCSRRAQQSDRLAEERKAGADLLRPFVFFEADAYCGLVEVATGMADSSMVSMSVRILSHSRRVRP